MFSAAVNRASKFRCSRGLPISFVMESWSSFTAVPALSSGLSAGSLIFSFGNFSSVFLMSGSFSGTTGSSSIGSFSSAPAAGAVLSLSARMKNSASFGGVMIYQRVSPDFACPSFSTTSPLFNCVWGAKPSKPRGFVFRMRKRSPAAKTVTLSETITPFAFPRAVFAPGTMVTDPCRITL